MRCPCATDGAEIARARALADHLLGHRVSKAWTFEGAVLRLGDLLRDVAGPAERAAAKAALAALDTDWARLSARERTRRVKAAVAAARGALRDVPKATIRVLGRSGVETVTTARRGLKAAVAFGAFDQRAVRRLTSSNALFVRDALGRRSDAMGARAKAVVARGLERGLGRADIAAELELAAEGLRGGAYWDVVAGAFTGTARSLGHLSAFADAGVRQYQLVAVMDEHTCFPRGTPIETAEGMRAIEHVLPGDRVRTHRGRDRRVLATRRRPSVRQLVCVRLADHRALSCTPNHLVLVRRDGVLGWGRADALRCGDVAFVRSI
jgi:hypothetical protein